MRTVTLIRAGIATTVQDVGRPGHQQSGIPPGGAMDEYAMHLGQRLLGHEDNEAALEFVYGDLAFTTSDRCHFVVTGAPASITIGAASSCSGRVIEVEANEMVTIKASGQGLYSYLHIAGGIATLPCLGSRSTSPREGVGGLEGRHLIDGDTLPLGRKKPALQPCQISAPGFRQRDILSLRFVPGFQFELFPESTRQYLQSQTFSVTPRSNRMGITLEGNPIETNVKTLLSEATCYGAIQIPPDGKPIILLNDRQTVGGYPKAGAVIGSDCQRLVQSRPGQRTQFIAITPQEADRIVWLEHHYRESKLS